MHGIIPQLFHCWANPVAHLLLLKSSMPWLILGLPEVAQTCDKTGAQLYFVFSMSTMMFAYQIFSFGHFGFFAEKVWSRILVGVLPQQNCRVCNKDRFITYLGSHLFPTSARMTFLESDIFPQRPTVTWDPRIKIIQLY